MKKLSTMLLATALVLSCAGCNDTTEAVAESTTTAATTTTAAVTEATSTAATTTAATTTEVTTVTEATTTTAEEVVAEPESVETPDTTEPSVPSNSNPAGDIKNPDGTYTQDFSSGEYSIPDCVVGTVDQAFFDRTERQSNPSMIPYSEITIENAHEAFPYTGWIGTSQVVLDNGAVIDNGPDMSPGYIEVLPTDSKETIEWKIRANTIGTSDTQFNYNLDDMNGVDVFERPHHFFASETDYNEFLVEWRRQVEDYQRRSEQARQEIESGNVDILGDLTEEDAQNIIDSWR